jgi:hypothetical protein
MENESGTHSAVLRSTHAEHGQFFLHGGFFTTILFADGKGLLHNNNTTTELLF